MIELRKVRSGRAFIIRLPNEYKRKLIHLGLIPGVEIEIIKNVKRQPFLLKVMGGMIAISRHIGRDIMVRELKK